MIKDPLLAVMFLIVFLLLGVIIILAFNMILTINQYEYLFKQYSTIEMNAIRKRANELNSYLEKAKRESTKSLTEYILMDSIRTKD